MKFIKVLATLAICYWGFVFADVAMAGEKPNLEGGNVLGHGQCQFPPNRGYCFLVEKDGLYVALHDEDGEKAIYKVKDPTARPNVMTPSMVDLVWERPNT